MAPRGTASIESDYRELSANARVVDLSAWTCVRVVGPDARSFLQGLATQDLGEPGASPAQTLFLTERGRPVALAWVGFDAGDGSAWILADEGARPTLRPHLDRFHVMEDVEIEGPIDRPILGVAGPERGDLFRRLRGASTSTGAVGLEAAPLSFLILPPGITPPAGFAAAAPEAFEAWRLAIGLPMTGADLDPDRIATELNLSEAISPAKGCFVGQEVVARTSNRGQVKRSRVGFRFDGAFAPLPPRAEIRADGAVVGYATSSAREPGTVRGLGMGYVTLEAQAQGGALTVVARPGPVPIDVAVWPL